MSDLARIHFDSFTMRRALARNDLQVQGMVKSMQTLAAMFIAAEKICAVGDTVDELLKTLHESAMRNNDFDAIAKCEVLSKQICEKLK